MPIVVIMIDNIMLKVCVTTVIIRMVGQKNHPNASTKNYMQMVYARIAT